MEINITSPRFQQDKLAQQFVNDIEARQQELNIENGILYYEFPLFKNIDENPEYTSFMLVSPNHGIVMIQCDDRTNRSLLKEEMDGLSEHLTQMYSTVLSNLIRIPELRERRNRLKFEITTILFLPNYTGIDTNSDDDIILVNSFSGLSSLFDDIAVETIEQDVINNISSIIEGTRAIPKPKNRNLSDEDRDTKGSLLEKLEKEITRFDRKQKIAALTQINGPQRIRGLAGSGKSVVLAMKAALIHLRDPEAMILYTFYTKALYDHIKLLITRFYRMYEAQDPNWDYIHIRHAWGGASLPGVYYDTCRENGITPLNFGDAKRNSNDPFDFVCKDLLDKTSGNLKRVYDYVLLDEGQDFEPSFYWLCRKIVKNDCLVWAYDELQNILNVEMQETNKLFENQYGDSGIDLEELQKNIYRQSNDIVLHKSYRNPREILVVAHAIGFGLYNEYVLQKLENKEHWEDVGYVVTKGNCNEGEYTVIERPLENSPLSFYMNQPPDKIIRTHIAQNMEEEAYWVSEAIKRDIEDKLLPEDILVICTDDRYARKYFDLIGRELSDLGINYNNLFDSFSGSNFIVEGSVTLSTVYKAKGNEAASVYVVGTDTFAFNKDDIVVRNKMFTAFTRAKAWLTVTGTGKNTSIIISEINKAIQNLPNLIFNYPGNVKTLRRELAEVSKRKYEAIKQMQEMFEKLEKMGIDGEEAYEDWLRSKDTKK